MKALISPQEIIYKYDGTSLGSRVAQVSYNSFDIAPPLFWVDCANDVVADQFYYDSNNQTINAIPAKPVE
jgi:hypothetical protein